MIKLLIVAFLSFIMGLFACYYDVATRLKVAPPVTQQSDAQHSEKNNAQETEEAPAEDAQHSEKNNAQETEEAPAEDEDEEADEESLDEDNEEDEVEIKTSIPSDTTAGTEANAD
ncbi:hypothetical protein [Candidatus Venteria ishoeyi]|uniref:Uncharacterized protein n=1 Tax=Candidatus Venteria ishoeyi TaxID=1899563 RepID=A0A1H6F857_9GAMM|nr:hypothetical protein [Candidatus Venteria ishoeyi]SEH05234.1 Uncharacterised protein [Candidatus Venteria ishoeyi]